jgi:TolA-binding protein
MVRLCTFFAWIFLVVAPSSLWAAEAEENAFRAATDAFRDKFYERADEQLGAFIKSFPASTNLNRAVLLQAQARNFLKKHDAAIELLQENLPKAGSLADEYLLTWGDALGAKGDYAGAADKYGRLLKEVPQSPLKLQAAYSQALSAYRQKDFDTTIKLLGEPEGEFQKLSAAAPEDRLSFAGKLLWADALLAAGKLKEAAVAAEAIPIVPNRPEWHWERFDALARVELAGTNSIAALSHLTNAVAAAQSAQNPRLQAQSWTLEAELYRKLGQTKNAVAVFDKIASVDALPVDQRRLAVLKSVELLSNSGELNNAIQKLESYLNVSTNEPAADLLKVKAGELWIDHARLLAADRGANSASLTAATNALATARAHLNSVITQHTNSAHSGRAWLNLGWSLWEEGMLLEQPARMQESESAFRTAAEKLTRSDDQAVALFKTADAQMRLQQPEAAITNYTRVIKEFSDLPQVKNALFAKTYAQLIRANVELGNLPGAEENLARLRSEYPNNPVTEESVLTFGLALLRTGESQKARALFQEFLSQYPSSSRAAEMKFAEARTYGTEGDFATALQKHEQWLQVFTNHTSRADVEFQHGVLLDRLGQGTNALTVFTNFVSRFPLHPLAPAAQTWVADHFHSQESWARAEQSYQRVFQNTNWIGLPLAYYSRMMAARTAFQRGGYNDARSYLTNLVIDPKCPADLKAEAWFALGDIFLEEPITGSTNALHNFTQAAAVFDRIVSQYPTNQIALLALAKKGDCYFQIAAHTNFFDSYVTASNAYSTVLKSAALSMKARNQAEFGLARVLEKMAEGKSETERLKLRKTALNHLLNIVYGNDNAGQRADPFYLKLGGREAGRLAEELGERDAAIALYKRLSVELPASRSLWQSRISVLQKDSGTEAGL